MSVDFDQEYIRSWAEADYEDGMFCDYEEFEKECEKRGLFTSPDFEEDCIGDYYDEYLDVLEELATDDGEEETIQEIKELRQ